MIRLTNNTPESLANASTIPRQHTLPEFELHDDGNGIQIQYAGFNDIDDDAIYIPYDRIADLRSALAEVLEWLEIDEPFTCEVSK